MSNDRRRYARIEADLDCIVATEDGTVPARVVNLSRSGVAILTEKPFAVGASLALHVEQVEGLQNVGLTGTVARISQVGDQPLSGVKFDALPPPAEEALIELIRTLATGKGNGRREHPRIAARVAVVCKSRESFEATLSDLSKGGVQLKCPKKVDPGMVLELAMGVQGHKDLFTLSGEIRRVEPSKDGTFTVGVRFIPPSETETKGISNLLDVLLGIDE